MNDQQERTLIVLDQRQAIYDATEDELSNINQILASSYPLLDAALNRLEAGEINYDLLASDEFVRERAGYTSVEETPYDSLSLQFDMMKAIKQFVVLGELVEVAILNYRLMEKRRKDLNLP